MGQRRGCWFHPESSPNTGEQLRNRVVADFGRIASWGVKVVRMWALYRGQGLVCRPDGTVAGISPELCQAAQKITERAVDNGLQIYWGLHSFEHFMAQSGGADYRTLLVPRCHRLITDETARSRFIEAVARDFVPAVNRANGLFAIDLCNELDGVFALGDRAGALASREWSHPSLFRRDYISALDDMARRLKALHPDVLVSAGFRHSDTVRDNWQELPHFDFFDCHHYQHGTVCNAHPGVPSYASLGIDGDRSPERQRKCLVGEFGIGGQILPTVGRALSWASDEATDARELPWWLVECTLRSRPVWWSVPPHYGSLNIGANPMLARLYRLQEILIRSYFHRCALQGYAGGLVWQYGGQQIRVQSPVDQPPEGELPAPAWADVHALLYTDVSGTLRERPAVRSIRSVRRPNPPDPREFMRVAP